MQQNAGKTLDKSTAVNIIPAVMNMNPVLFAKTLADESRQQIMRALCCQWLCVNEVVERVALTQPTVSHHLGVLRQAGLVLTRREGKQIYYTLNQDRVADCCGLLMEVFAPERLAAEGGTS